MNSSFAHSEQGRLTSNLEELLQSSDVQAKFNWKVKKEEEEEGQVIN